MWVKWVKQYHGPKSRCGHICQNIAWTRPHGLVLYKGCIWVKKAAHPPEGGPAEAGDLSGSNLQLIDLPSGTNARRPSQKPEVWASSEISRIFLYTVSAGAYNNSPGIIFAISPTQQYSALPLPDLEIIFLIYFDVQEGNHQILGTFL